MRMINPLRVRARKLRVKIQCLTFTQPLCRLVWGFDMGVGIIKKSVGFRQL
jgi:hypothetical protein